MNNEFVVKTSFQKTILYQIGCLVFVIAGLYMFYVSDDLYTRIIMLICAGVFGFGFLVLIYFGLFDRRPRIVIDEIGIYDRLLGVGKINWEDIKHIRFDSDDKNPLISIKLANTLNSSKILVNARNKRFSSIDGDLDFGILSLNLNFTDAEPQKIYAMILKHIPDKQISDTNKLYED